MKATQLSTLLMSVFIALTTLSCKEHPEIAPAGFTPTKENVQFNVYQMNDIPGTGYHNATTDVDLYLLDGGHKYNLDDNGAQHQFGSDRIDARKMACETHGVVEYRTMSLGGNFGKENVNQFGRYLVVVQMPYMWQSKLCISLFTFETTLEKGKYLDAKIYFDAFPNRIQKMHKHTKIEVKHLGSGEHSYGG